VSLRRTRKTEIYDVSKDFINLQDFTPRQLGDLIRRTMAEKKPYRAGRQGPTPLAGKTLALIFEKPSLRTRVSFEVAMTHLGGASVYLDNAAIGIGTREAIQDIARVLGGMCDGLCARTFRHSMIEKFAEWTSVPVINALSNESHPCQAMADLVTAAETFGDLAGRTLVFIGDGNNVARSLAVACAKLNMKFVLSCPKGYELPEAFFERLLTDNPGADCAVIPSPLQAVAAADVIYTDTWVSMGQEDQRDQRVEAFAKYQINAELLAAAPDKAIVLHCLPAYRGYEITDEAFEAHAETIFAQSANRLHFQRTLLGVLLGEGGIK
jgi:ornithine carbamoyltransferase